MSYKSKWIDLPELRTIAEQTYTDTSDLVDRDSHGDSLQGAYGANAESKLRSWGISTARIMSALANAFGWSLEEREHYPQCDQ